MSAGALADTVVVQKSGNEGAGDFLLKRIVEKLGNRLRALVIDRDGREQKIYITADDVVEIKRGLWVIRPGTYQTDI
jgi:hypothetical protein